MFTQTYSPWSPTGVQQRQGRFAAALVGLAVVAFVGTVAAVVIANRPATRDATSGCLTAGVEEHSIVLVDLTDPIPERELPAVRAQIERRATALPSEARLTVLALAPEGDKNTKLLFDRCKPPDGSTTNRWVGNRELEKKEYAIRFTTPLQSAMQYLHTTRKHDRSPIIAALSAAATDVAFVRAPKRSIYLVSDLIDTEVFDAYRSICKFEVIERAGYKPVRDLKGSLGGAAVLLLQTRRIEAGKYQTPALAACWQELMVYAGLSDGTLRFERP